MPIEYGDILLNNDKEIFSQNGDLSNGNNKEHQIGAIVNADFGNFRKQPTLACALTKNLDGVSDSRDIVADIIDGTVLDGWRIDDLDINTESDELEVTIKEAEKVTDDTFSLI